MAEANLIYIGNAHGLIVDGLRDAITGAYQNSATVAWALLQTDGTSIATGSYSYVAASNGEYTGEIPAANTSGLTEGTDYHVRVTATVGGVQAAQWRLVRRAAYRQEC
jgi:hypothetical protein